MKKALSLLSAALLLLALLGGCAAPQAAAPTAEPTAAPTPTPLPEPTPEPEYTLSLQIDSAAIAKNIIGDTSVRNVYVYLPPSYYDGSDKRYPVVYFLHGYGDNAESFITGNKALFNKAFADGGKEFIAVALDGNNKSGGSFYVNSPVLGNWDDFITKEVVSTVDAQFRTLADAKSRGISGYSMGGFGALNLATLHPDVFSAALVFCPGVFAEENFDLVIQSWQYETGIRRSYAQAFAPNLDDPEDHSDAPDFTGSDADKAATARWFTGFSNWSQKLDAYQALGKPLSGIWVVYGKTDGYDWIPLGCEHLANLFVEKGMNYATVTPFSGGHIVPGNAPAEHFVPFFGEKLTF